MTAIRSEQTYSWRPDIRRYHAGEQAIGSLTALAHSQWTVHFTRPQSSGLPWTDLHTPAILATYTFAAGDWQAADAFARDWLEGEYNRHRFGDEIADVVADYFTFEAAMRR